MRDFVSFDTWKDADKRIKTDDAFHNTKNADSAAS